MNVERREAESLLSVDFRRWLNWLQTIRQTHPHLPLLANLGLMYSKVFWLNLNVFFCDFLFLLYGDKDCYTWWPEEPQVIGGNITGVVRAGPLGQKHFSAHCLCRLTGIPSVLTLVILLQTKWIHTVMPEFWEEKSAKGEITLTSRGMFTLGKNRRKTAQWCVCQPCSAWQHSSHVGYWGRWLNMRYWNEKKKSQGKANNWIWLSLCARQCGHVCTAGACAHCNLSREQGLVLPGTSTVHWRITGRLPLPAQGSHKSLLTNHNFSYGKTVKWGADWPGSSAVLDSLWNKKN